MLVQNAITSMMGILDIIEILQSVQRERDLHQDLPDLGGLQQDQGSRVG